MRFPTANGKKPTANSLAAYFLMQYPPENATVTEAQ
jgi:hypothetical protein